ncbi:hypothetical protein HPP92_016965 [Vanilla planifolia]|uniref:Autophagy-related protein 2 n=1 Tax=Vanilla planifolia TaxID=51239 RepID=A0A835UQY8_VANPL|nr:hypothetical protein HPP92_016965 [Vanilla planifolia]
MAKLTNFMKFQGAVIEILTMPNTDNRSHALDSSESNYSTSSLLSGSTAVILTGRSSGFSGRLNLAIPWKNGSLDFLKVDANVFLDPIELRLQPSTIEWIVVVWESLISAGTAASSGVRFNAKEFSHSSSSFYNNSNVSSSSIHGADAMKPSSSKVLEKLHSGICEEKFLNDTFTRTHVIQDWVSLAFKEHQKELEQDYGKSISFCSSKLHASQEYLVGIDICNAQPTLGGLWNWTYSVFSAINVASNLASGSCHALKEQQLVETCLRATVAGFSLILNFVDKEENLSDQLAGSDKNKDEFCQLGCASSQISNLQESLNEQSFLSYMSCFSSLNVDQSALSEPNPTGLKIHHLEAKCLDVEIDYQVGPRNRHCQISIRHAKVDEYYDHKTHGRMFALSDDSSPYAHMIINNRLKENVSAALSPFLWNSDGSSVLSTSFSVHLPPCNIWFHFHLAVSLLNLFDEVENYFARSRSSKNRDLPFDYSSSERKFTSTNDMLNDNSSGKIIPSRENVQGDIIFSHTRITICFPLHGWSDFTYLYPIGNFLILEHSPLLLVEEVLKFSPTPSKHPNASGNSCIPAFSIHFVVGTFDIYMTDRISKDADMIPSLPLYMKEVSVVKVASVTNRIGGPYSGVRIVWQKGPVTGPWMASRIWGLASAHNHRSTNKINAKDCEFSSVTAVKDLGEINSDVYKELLLSSSFLLYIHVSVFSFNLNDHYYRLLNGLMDVVVCGFSNGAYSKLSAVEEQPLCKHDVFQINFNIHCDRLDLSFAFDEVPHCSNSVQKELEGSWNSFKLTVENFEIMSVSNVGGIHAYDFFLLNHGEGELWSSITSGSNIDSARTQDFLLISCKNSARRRGGGDGVNLLSFGSAGTTITYVCNPQAFSSYMSIHVRCATIFAPGGRFDWISIICLFFSLPSDNKTLQGDQNHGEPSSASVSLSNQMLTSIETTEYHIQIKDAGLLIGESSGLKNDYCSYDVSYLQRCWEETPENDGNSIGLLDEIMENAFHIGEEPNYSLNAFWMDSIDCGRSARNREVIGPYNNKDHPRESYAKALKLDLETVRPDPATPLEDYSIPSITEPHGESDEVGRLSIADRKSKIYDSQTFVEEALLPFFQGIDLDLKTRLCYWCLWLGSVCETVIGQWLEDISHNQVHKLLKGLAPIRSFVSVASGTHKLITLPVKSYRRDKKLLKGIQSISLEAVGLGMHLAAGAHEMLLQTEYVLANIPLDNEKGRTKKITNTNQPGDAQEGIWQAYESLADGLSRTASAMFGAPIKEYQRGAGAGLALATAIRGAPAAAIAPVTASARAVHCALVGMRNSLNPDHKKESIDKYLGPSRS